MKNDTLLFTAGQFAKLLHLNKRTLHYYDEIGLFSPAYKGDNKYRYYTYQQSIQLENILTLREMGMSIEEVKEYFDAPDPDSFQQIITEKTREIEDQIRHLKLLRSLLKEKQAALEYCEQVYDGKIELAEEEERYLLLTPIKEKGEVQKNMAQIMEHLYEAQRYNTYKMGCGSYLSVEKVRRQEFDEYDGVFTPVRKKEKGENFKILPAGKYLRGYCIGSWDKIPGLYLKMLSWAEENKLNLTGNCYETGLNEFAISSPEEYVTQIMIQCELETREKAHCD